MERKVVLKITPALLLMLFLVLVLPTNVYATDAHIDAVVPKFKNIPVSEAYPLWTIQIEVTVGFDATATFSVICEYYNGITWVQIGSQSVTFYAYGTKIVTFDWNLSSVPLCSLEVRARHDLPGDTNPGNDELSTFVKVKKIGDVNNDCSVNVLDIIQVMINLGSPASPNSVQCDVNGDCTVNVLDIMLVQSNLGPCPPCT